jgi:hypothetical protein
MLLMAYNFIGNYPDPREIPSFLFMVPGETITTGIM